METERDIDYQFKEEIFEDFKVTIYNDKHCFVHIKINEDCFYDKLFEYFFSGEKLLRYVQRNSKVKFNINRSDYGELYKFILIFLDEEVRNIVENNDNALQLICNEFEEKKQNNKTFLRLDKIGKLGEYIFCNLLFDYFHVEPLILKLNYLFNYNDNIKGIDVLFYDSKKDLLLLGESKVSENLKNGIQLINKDLKQYQQRIDNEYKLVLSKRIFRDELGKFGKRFKRYLDKCVQMSKFIELAGVKTICVPIFIAHGEDTCPKSILSEMKKINYINLYGIDTTFLLISLPLIDKNEFVKSFTLALSKKMKYYYMEANEKE